MTPCPPPRRPRCSGQPAWCWRASRVAYVAATALRAPVGVVAAAGAAALAAVVARSSPRVWAGCGRDVSWSVLLFVAGLFVIVQGLEDTGVTGAVLHWWLGVGSGSPPSAVSAFAGAAAGSNLVNNLPMTLVTLSGLHPLGRRRGQPRARCGPRRRRRPQPDAHRFARDPALAGAVCARGASSISAATYMRYGVIVTIPALAAGAVGLLLTAR